MSEKSTSLIAQGYIDYNEQTFFYRATKLDDEILLDVSVVMGAKADEVKSSQFSFNRSGEDGKFHIDRESTKSTIDFAIGYNSSDELELVAKNMPLVGDLILTQNKNHDVVIKSLKNNERKELIVLDGEHSVIQGKNNTFDFKINGILEDVEKKSNSFIARLAKGEINKLAQAAVASIGAKGQALSSNRTI